MEINTIKEHKKRGPIFPVEGVMVGTAATGMRYKGRQDLAIFVINPVAILVVSSLKISLLRPLLKSLRKIEKSVRLFI